MVDLLDWRVIIVILGSGLVLGLLQALLVYKSNNFKSKFMGGSLFGTLAILANLNIDWMYNTFSLLQKIPYDSLAYFSYELGSRLILGIAFFIVMFLFSRFIYRSETGEQAPWWMLAGLAALTVILPYFWDWLFALVSTSIG